MKRHVNIMVNESFGWRSGSRENFPGLGQPSKEIWDNCFSMLDVNIISISDQKKQA